MRTTIYIEDDVLAAVKKLARLQNVSAGCVFHPKPSTCSNVKPASHSNRKSTKADSLLDGGYSVAFAG